MDADRVKEKTGKTLENWYALLNEQGGRELNHTSIAKTLTADYSVSPWWAQTVTVEYERFIGRRVPGQQSDGTFQTGIRKTLPVHKEALWGFLMANLYLWNDCDLVTRERFTTFVEGDRFRMPWKQNSWKKHSILQVRVIPGNSEVKAICAVHHENLPSLEDRDSLKTHWNGILSKLTSLINLQS